MAKITRTITINAPVEKVFTYVTEPTNLPEFWPSMIEVRDVRRLPNGGPAFHWVYKMAGLRFEGDSETTEFVANQHQVTRSESGIPNTFVWNYRAENGGTRLDLEVEYTVPIPVLGKLAEAVIVKANEREADTMLANLKDRMET